MAEELGFKWTSENRSYLGVLKLEFSFKTKKIMKFLFTQLKSIVELNF
jgi:hypothetical protein